MSLFTKKPRILKKATTKLELIGNQDFNVGETEVELTFSDGQTLTTLIYGQACQHVEESRDEVITKYWHHHVTEATVNPIYTSKSNEQAGYYISQLQPMVKNYTHETTCVIGQVTRANIKQTYDHIVTIPIYKVVPK